MWFSFGEIVVSMIPKLLGQLMPQMSRIQISQYNSGLM